MTAQIPAGFWSRGRILGAALACTVTGVFVAANIHLIAVSFASQPGCMPHLSLPQEGAAMYRAAKPSC